MMADHSTNLICQLCDVLSAVTIKCNGPCQWTLCVDCSGIKDLKECSESYRNKWICTRCRPPTPQPDKEETNLTDNDDSTMDVLKAKPAYSENSSSATTWTQEVISTNLAENGANGQDFIPSTIKVKDNSSSSRKDYYSWDESVVNALRKLVQNDKSINSRTDDIFLLSFLRARKFHLDRAYKLWKNYYCTRRAVPVLFRNFSPSSDSVRVCLDDKVVGCLLHTDDKGRVIVIVRMCHWDPSKIHVNGGVKSLLLILDMLLNDHLIQVNGCVLIVDAAGLSWRHVIQFTPIVAYRIVQALVGNNPVRYKEAHCLNFSTILHTILAIVLPFFPTKLKQRIHYHSPSEFESLHKFINPKYLPCEYGGELPPFDPTDCIKKLRENEEFFTKSERYWRAEKF